MSIDMQQFHAIFLEETQEHLDELEQGLMELNVQAPDAEGLNSIFRAAHSIKGGSGMFGFDALGAVTHLMENLLDRLRQGALIPTTQMVDVLLANTDNLKHLLRAYRQAEPIDWSLVERSSEQLERLLNPDIAAGADAQKGYGLFEQTLTPAQEEAFGFFDDEEDNSFGFFDDEPAADVKSASADVITVPVEQNQPSKNLSAPSKEKTTAPAATETSTIRVDTSKIDLLVNLAGELVINQSMLNTLGSEFEGEQGERLRAALVEMERNTREMQEAVMSIRMLPMSFVFNRFPRTVRDLCSKLEKQAELVLEGAHTEIDKGLIEKLVDPLTHLVRNSLDHGIEKPAVRKQLGKPEVGRLVLRAEQKGGNIVISITDDGAGLNRARILEKAMENGIPLPESPTDEQIWKLIFAAGFSTAEQVTDVSGRGVGMDVVRRNIESLGGQIDIESSAGKGSTFRIRLPLTLAIVDGMCVSASDQLFVLPLVNIIESIQPEPGQLKSLSNDRLLWVRDQYWPIVQLREAMTIAANDVDERGGIVVLLENSRQRFGLQVDALLGQQQVVIKSLEQHYKRVPGVAGATIMGDGQVALILDVESLADGVA